MELIDYESDYEPELVEQTQEHVTQRHSETNVGRLALVGDMLAGDDDGEIVEKLKAVTLSNDSLRDYLQAIGRYTLLTAEQEVHLAWQIEAGLFAGEKLENQHDDLNPNERRELATLAGEGKRAKDAMLSANLRLVVNLAKRYSHASGMPIIDLIQDGNVGLNRAVEKFDYTKGNKFSTYATWWIRQSIGRAIADTQRPIRLPGARHNEMVNYKRTLAELASLSENGDYDDEDIAAAMDISLAKLKDIRSFDHTMTSLSRPVGYEDDRELADVLVGTDGSVEETIEAMSLHGDIEVAISSVLNDEESTVIKAMFGIDVAKPMSSTEVSEMTGMSIGRVKFLNQNAMAKLRKDEGVREMLIDYLETRAA